MTERRTSDNLPEWLFDLGLDIMRHSLSDRLLAQRLPDLLQLFVHREDLLLAPRAAIFGRTPGRVKESLLGHYNAAWWEVETELEFGEDYVPTPDPYSKLFRFPVTLLDQFREPVGHLLLYTHGREPVPAARRPILSRIARFIAAATHDARAGGRMSQACGTDTASCEDTTGLLRTILDSFPGGICVMARDLTITMTNSRLYSLLDLPEERFAPGCNFEDILRYNAERGDYGPGDIDSLVDERLRHAKLFLENVFERGSASGQVLEARSSPTPGGGGVLTYVDITARKKAERALLEHRDELERTVETRTAEIGRQAAELQRMLEHERLINELQRQFVAMASHEFRTPLAIIDGAAHRLLRRKGEISADYVSEKAEQIRTSVARMVELMESILSTGRLEDGKIEITPGPCSLRAIVEDCCTRQGYIKSGHSFHLDLARLPGEIVADGSALRQVVTNLLSNAVKYAPRAPDIHVSGWQENGMVHVAVRDEGIGIDADDLPKMFQRYFRARSSSGIAGTGIGLNLVKQILELHGGSIAVTSKKGEGSTFTFSLPLEHPCSEASDKNAHAA